MGKKRAGSHCGDALVINIDRKYRFICRIEADTASMHGSFTSARYSAMPIVTARPRNASLA